MYCKTRIGSSFLYVCVCDVYVRCACAMCVCVCVCVCVCAVVGMMAHTYNIPFLVCCETYKFHQRVQLDSICYNELGNYTYVYIYICVCVCL